MTSDHRDLLRVCIYLHSKHLPTSPVAKTPSFQHRGPRFILGQGTRSHMLQQKILCVATKTQHSQINNFLLNKFFKKEDECSKNARYYKVCCGALSLSHVQLFATPWTVARQAPLSMEFSRQYWSGLPFPPPGDLPNPGIEPRSPAMAGRFFTTVLPGKPVKYVTGCVFGFVLNYVFIYFK